MVTDFFKAKCILANKIKGSNRQCMVVDQSMQYCRTSFGDLFMSYKTFPRCIITEYDCKVDVQNHEFGFQNRLF